MSTPKVLVYTGERPDHRDPAVPAEKVLAIMLAQLRILEQMTVSYVFVPAGTKLTPLDLKETK